MDKNYILGVGVTNAKKEETLEFIVTSLQGRGKKLSIFTPNPEIIMHANGDSKFKNILNSAEVALADGIGVIFAAQVMGKSLKERITGIDFMLDLCRVAEKNAFTVGLLGGGPKIAERTAECLLRIYPRLRIVFVGSEWPSGWLRSPTSRSKSRSATGIDKSFSDPSSLSERRPLEVLQNHKQSERSAFNSFAGEWAHRQPQTIDILFVALGFPKQERWIFENLPKIDVKVAMAVGGSFDYISGALPRAPLFIRNLGLEWLFRLLREPWRFDRQLALPKFLFAVLKEFFFEGD